MQQLYAYFYNRLTNISGAKTLLLPPMQTDNQKRYSQMQRSLSPRHIVLPVFIGLSVTAYMLYNEIEEDTFDFLHWTAKAVFWIFMGFIMMVVRDLAYMWRIRILTNKQLNWRASFNVIMLWEFSSAISPSVVGGTGPAIFFLYKEGINSGKSTAIVLTAIFLDELFFIFSVPLLIWFWGAQAFPTPEISSLSNVITYFWIAYGVIFLYTLLLAYALFINPKTVKNLLSYIFLFPLLKRWRLGARRLGNQLIITSRELKANASVAFWFKSVLSTIISWTGRYAVINCIFLAFFFNHLQPAEHFLVYARQLTMWILLLISPTPGGSGVAEYIFRDFLGDLIPNVGWAVPLAIIWRLISYYPYLIIGVIILPNWLRKKFFGKK